MKPVPVNSKLGRVGCIAGIVTLVIVVIGVIIAIATGGGTGTPAQSTPTFAQATHAPGKTVTASTPTPAPTATATPAPTDTPTPQPTPTTAPPTQLAVTFTATTAGSISVQTSPGAALTIKVHYNCSGHDATSQSLQGTVHADSGGAYTWVWDDSSKCTGTITATVTAVLSGHTVTSATTF